MARTPQRIPPANPPREEAEAAPATNELHPSPEQVDNALAGFMHPDDEQQQDEPAAEPFDVLEDIEFERRIRNATATTEDPFDASKGWLPPGFVRQPFGERQLKLSYPKRPGFHRHWFNDWPGRIESAVAAGYKVVRDRDGKPVKKTVGTSAQGGGLVAFLMEIPEEFYLQDMRAQQAVNDATKQAIRGGSVNDKADGNRYVPKDGIKVGNL